MKQRICYMCSAEATSEEHIPPKAFFPPGRQKNGIVVPSCHEHNTAKSDDDQFALNFLAGSIGQNPIGAQVHGNKIGAYIEKYSRGSDTLLRRFFPDWREVDFAGLRTGAISMDVPRFAAWIAMLVRGIWFHHTGEKLLGEIFSDWGALRSKDLQPSKTFGSTYLAESLLPPPAKGLEPDIFAYDFHQFENGEIFFRLRFFEGMPVYAIASKQGP